MKRLLLASALLLIVSACDDQRPEPMQLRVMTFNIEYGGAHVSFEKVAEAIRASNADIVGIQEAEGNLQRLAAELGWYYDERNYAISKYPLLDPPGADGLYVLVEVLPGKVVALANVHLPSDPYGVYALRDGATLEEVLQIERDTRLPKILPYLETLKPLFESGVPVFMTGDFNAPAHTDWTPEMVGKRPFLTESVAWPVSVAVATAGFHDSWRVAYPDPKKHPGLTWWARRPPLEVYQPDDDDAEDRIDFLWYAGPVKLVSSEIVGEKDMPEVSIAVDPWVSDHRAVVSQFSVTPVAAPPLVTTRHRVYSTDDDVEFLFRGARNAEIRIEPDSVLVEDAASNGQLVIAATSLSAGRYTVSMSNAGDQNLQREFWILDRDAKPGVAVLGDVFDVNEAIGVTWHNAPGYRNDFVAVVEVGAVSVYDGALTWQYVNSLPDGKLELDAATAEWGWPLPPGRYVVRLVKDDGYEVLAESAPFDIR